MFDTFRRYLGFPYPAQYEKDYNRDLMKRMHKPLLIAVIAVLMFLTWIVGICIFWPETIAPAQYIRGLLTIHFVFMTFTIIILFIVIGFRRQLFLYPNLHVIVCNFYAMGICLWSSVLSAYANYSAATYTAFNFVMLCVSMVSLFKPWLAVVVYSGNYTVYFILARIFSSMALRESVAQLYTAAIAAVLGMVISIAFYRFRTRTYYDKQIIDRQLDQINKINHELQQLIHIDNLTGFFNRRFYEEKLQEELDEIATIGNFCCVMLDIDYFKSFNDKYGHPEGDECLRSVAKLIKEAVESERAYPVRYGGEEFLIAAETESSEDSFALAELIRSRIENAYIINAASPFGKVTVSCGLVYCGCSNRWELHEITKKADNALYASKQNGRNMTTVYNNELTSSSS